MIQLARLLVAFAFLLGACGAPHLGSDTGRAYRAAVAAQQRSTAEPLPPMSAADARRVLATHGGAGPEQATATGGAAVIPAVSFEGLSSDGGSMWQGASGGIRLEAR